MQKNLKISYLLLFVLTLLLIFICKFNTFEVFERLDETFRDFILRNHFFNADKNNQEKRFVIVDIDESTINDVNKFEQNFLPRQKIADLIEILLLDYNVKAMALDIIFTKPAKVAENDERLLALSEFAPLVFAQTFDYYQRFPNISVGYLNQQTNFFTNFETKQNLAVNAKGYIANFLQLSQQINCSGNIGYIPDNDGVLRVIPLFTKYNDKNTKNKQIYSHLTLSLLLCYDKIFKQYQNQNLTALSENLNTQNFWRIPYTKTMEDYTVIPANLFFDNSKITQFMPLDDFKNLLKNKYVLIGSSAVSLGDRTSTPLLALTPGILVHAQILSALLDSTYNDFNAKSNAKSNANSNINENFPRETKNFFQNLVENIDLIWSLIFVISFFALLVINKKIKRNNKINVLTITFLLILQILLWAIFSAYLIYFFNNQLNQIKLLLPINISLFLLFFVIPFEWRNLQKNNQKLTQIFKSYVGQSVLDEILKTNDDFLQANYADVSVLIVDIVGFTKTVEALNLQKSAKLIKSILELLTKAVIATNGTLDKYNGDGLIAFWGAPLEDKNHAENCIFAAIKMFDFLDQFNQKYNLNINIRIGIESGKVLVGDLGTDFRSSYTILGNCINYASRLENIAHSYKNLQNFPRKILIGENTQKILQNLAIKNNLLHIGKIKLRGSQNDLDIYTLK